MKSLASTKDEKKRESFIELKAYFEQHVSRIELEDDDENNEETIVVKFCLTIELRKEKSKNVRNCREQGKY